MASIKSPPLSSYPRAPPRYHRPSARFDHVGTLTNPQNVQSSMFVIDPKTFATRLLVRPTFDDVLEGTNTRLVRLFVWLKRSSESWFTHLFLLLALILYACLGGAIFSSIEGKHENEQNEIIRKLHVPIDQMAKNISNQLWSYRQQFPLPTDSDPTEYELSVDLDWYREVSRQLDIFNQTIIEQCTKRLNYSLERFTPTNRWDFVGSVFFSMTVFTTIGYGDHPPVTTLGKTVTMIYSFFGIPLLLIVLADFGKIFTKSIKYLIMFFRRLYYDRSMRSVRHINRKGTKAAKVQAAFLDALHKIQRSPPFYIDPKTGRVTMIRPPPPTEISDPMIRTNTTTRTIPLVTSPIGGAKSGLKSPTSITITPDTPMPAMIAYDDLDDEFNLPISLALFILMFYMFLGAILFWAFESWTLFHAFYFVFISMSTIGFGDFVPTKFNVLLYAFMYFLFGLALTSMCINVIQEKLSSTFEKARVTIGESIGLDPTSPITIIQQPPPASLPPVAEDSKKVSSTSTT